MIQTNAWLKEPVSFTRPQNLKVFRAPYVVEQPDGEETVSVSFEVPDNVTAKDIIVTLTSDSIVAGVKGEEPKIEGKCFAKIDKYSLWQIESHVVTIHLEKQEQQIWPIVVIGPREKDKVETIDAHSQYILGIAYCGQVFSSDMEMAFNYYRAAALRGHVLAQIGVAKFYQKGTEHFPANHREAFRFFKMAADLGNEEALYELGKCYHQGLGVEPSQYFAKECYTESGSAEAMFELATILLEEEEFEEAKNYFKIAYQLDTTDSIQHKIPIDMNIWISTQNRKQEHKREMMDSTQNLNNTTKKNTEEGKEKASGFWSDGLNVAFVTITAGVVVAFTLAYALSPPKK
eukprot:CAMPEP_0174261292 /NCGR_PEP_ID=MMETSP0439-20130205/11347_1 /TAXON_ID=0 /ORGANISM="Stereomyxa ramosa, Strain Chinc5" /LENGTH=345 /DNA_ID=CAMNT_0015345747 /DNA_START=14 /DNA_END=1051 /DNA_ORIENTATION=-